MSTKLSILILLFLFSLSFLGSPAEAIAQTANPRILHERLVVRALSTINSAQATYAATTGAGNYGSFNQLMQAGFIDAVLATGEKYGYSLLLVTTSRTTTTPASFHLTATPLRYPKTGRRSFYFDARGDLRGADKNGTIANDSDPMIDWCTAQGSSNEFCVIQDLRLLHGAEMTYQSTYGNGNFGVFEQLYDAGLIRQSLRFGQTHGYNFTVYVTDVTQTTPAFFKIKASPTNYGVSGVRSFYIDVAGVLRGADKNGEPADENDPPITN